MIVYISTALERVGDARALAEKLRAAGHEIVSHWHDDANATRSRESTLTAKERHAIYTENVSGIHASNVFVCLADARCRGTLAEIGIADTWALDRGRLLVLVGDGALLGPMGAACWDTECTTLDDVPAVIEKFDRGDV